MISIKLVWKTTAEDRYMKLVTSLIRLMAMFATFSHDNHSQRPINGTFYVGITISEESVARANSGAWELIQQPWWCTYGRYSLSLLIKYFNFFFNSTSVRSLTSVPQFVMNLSHGAILVAWELMSILKTAKGVSFERVSASHPFECITLPTFPRFHACIKICSFLICFCVMLL